ncbi:MAG: M14 family zinc carboxypeptidase [Blastocatellia bacterium]
MSRFSNIGWWLSAGLLVLLAMTVDAGHACRTDMDAPQSGNRRAPKEVAAPTLPRFLPDADQREATWEDHLAYYRLLDRRSERLELTELGRTTLGRPLVMLAVSAPENLRDLERQRSLPGRLSGPRKTVNGSGQAQSMGLGQTVVLVTSGSGSGGDAGPRIVAGLVHRLLTDQSPEVLRVLKEMMILVVPSINPDGQRAGPDQGPGGGRVREADPAGPDSALLSDRYAGLEADEDWDAFTRVETRLLADKLLNSWQPRVWYEIGELDTTHPPPPAGEFQIELSSPWARFLVPAGMTAKIRRGREERTDAAFWSRHHGGIHLRSSFVAPSSSPLQLPPIVDQQVNGAVSVLTRAAIERQMLHRRLMALSRPSPQLRPYAYLLPEPVVPSSISNAYQQLSRELKKVTGSEKERHDQTAALYGSLTDSLPSPGEVSYYYRTEGLDRLLAILRRGGVEVRRATQPFVADGREWPAGTHLVRLADQSSAADFARAILEPSGMVARSLPLLLNVTVIRVDRRFSVESGREPTAIVLQERIRENGGIRVGIFQGSRPSADAAWTRWILDQYRFGYQSIDEGDLGARGLDTRFDAIILPDQPAPGTSVLNRDGVTGGTSHSSGPGRGMDPGALRHFVETGGTLVTFNRSSLHAISWLDLPVRNARESARTPRAGSPGAILRLSVDSADQLSLGVGRESIAWFEAGPAFEIVDPRRARTIAHFARTGPLVLEGTTPAAATLRGRSALVEVKYGLGRVILFAFRPQYRGRSLATYPFLFNALLTSSRAGR